MSDDPRCCPACTQVIDDQTSVDKGPEHKPSPGDISICFYCAAVLTFGDDLSLAVCIDPKIIGDQKVIRARMVVRAMIRRRRASLN